MNRSYRGTRDTEGTLLDAGDTRGDTLNSRCAQCERAGRPHLKIKGKQRRLKLQEERTNQTQGSPEAETFLDKTSFVFVFFYEKKISFEPGI